MKRSRIYFVLVVFLAGVLASMFAWSRQTSAAFFAEELGARRELVRKLTLTDLALWTEARYTRHPAVADLFSAFQDHPGAFDHFPAGSLLGPTGPRAGTTLEILRPGQL